MNIIILHLSKTIYNISSLQEMFLGDNFLFGSLPLETSHDIKDLTHRSVVF